MKYKITNPTRRTFIVHGHQLKCGESIELNEINFTEPCLVVEKIVEKQPKSSRKTEVKSSKTDEFEINR